MRGDEESKEDRLVVCGEKDVLCGVAGDIGHGAGEFHAESLAPLYLLLERFPISTLKKIGTYGI